MGAYAGTQFVGIDLHRRRSVIVRTTETGEVLEAVQIHNDVERVSEVMARAGEDPEVVLEATYGWYWAVDALQDAGASVHLAHPLGVKAFEYRRVKNDVRDGADLADVLRMGRLPEAWIAPPATRELRELVRHRAKLVALRSNVKAQVHAVLAKCGIQVALSDLFGVAGLAMLDRLDLPTPFAARVASHRRLIEALDFEIDLFDGMVRGRLARHAGYVAVQTIPGIGPILGAVLVAEIGDVTRFTRPEQLTSWAGLTPKHHESDTHVHRGRITKQGSRLVRWAAVEPVQRAPASSPVGQRRERVGGRRGRNIGVVAAARQQLEYVFYAAAGSSARRRSRGPGPGVRGSSRRTGRSRTPGPRSAGAAGPRAASIVPKSRSLVRTTAGSSASTAMMCASVAVASPISDQCVDSWPIARRKSASPADLVFRGDRLDEKRAGEWASNGQGQSAGTST